MSRGVSPTGGMLKRMFDPKNIKKKEKTALGVAKPGGEGIGTYKGFKGKK